MQTLYQAANAIEAHMILHLLKQSGIHGHVLGEHLQGAIGELPAAGLVRVVVEEADYPRGRQLIQEWEASLPKEIGSSLPDEHSDTAHWSRSWAMLFIGVAIGVAGSYSVYRLPECQRASGDVVQADKEAVHP